MGVFGDDEIFSRQVEALGRAGDVLFVHTTSGNSPNILAAFATAKEKGLRTLAMLGRDGGKAAGLAETETRQQRARAFARSSALF